MAAEPSSRRATCPSCSKPSPLCLCTRIKHPNLNNSIFITVLQHSLEQNHPLNSTRIAALGLKNLKIVPVFDVHLEAQFCIWPICSGYKVGLTCFEERSNGYKERFDLEKTALGVKNVEFVEDSVGIRSFGSDSEMGMDCFEEMNKGSRGNSGFEKTALGVKDVGVMEDSVGIRSFGFDSEMGMDCFEEMNKGSRENSVFEKTALGVKDVGVMEDSVGIPSFGSDSEMGMDCFEEMNKGSREKSVFEKSDLGLKNLNVVPELVSERSIGSILKEGFGCFDECSDGCDEGLVFEEPLISFKVSKKGVIGPNFDLLFGSPLVLDALAKGFIVKKWQNKSVNGSITHERFEEFEILVPPGSALLFPSENSVGIEDIDFGVKNLIVLDGTWAKAKRMYSENPWLKALPHLRLDLDKLSLYSEVRRQPKAGYLSSLESIVYAMKDLGEKSDGFYQLLEVFESMIVDQRRCKEESVKNFSEPGSIDTHSSKQIPTVNNFYIDD